MTFYSRFPKTDRLPYMDDHDAVVKVLIREWRKIGEDNALHVAENRVGGIPSTTMYAWEGGVSPTLFNACRLARVMGYQLQVVPAPKANEVQFNPT